MKIKGHRLEGVEFREAHAYGGEFKPELLVLHDTAGRLTPKSSVDWFASEECPTSAHVVVERDGTITQMVPFNRKAWHAGASVFNGRANCNAFALGIEIVNPGLLDKDGRAWFHKKTERGFDVKGLKRVKTKEHGDGWWMPYTQEQIEAVTSLCKALAGAYPDISDVTTHWFISPKRKIDTNPLFPVEAVRRAALGVRGEEEVAALEPMAPKPETIVAKAADLAPVSRKASLAQKVRDWLLVLGIGGTGMSAADAAGLGKGYLDGLTDLLKDHGALLFVVGCFAGAVVAALFLKWMVQDYADGRYTPSKE